MSLELVSRGETSNLYKSADFPHLLFIERTDNFSIDDIVFPDTIYSKGVVLNQMSNCWMELLEKSGIINTAIIASDPSSLLKLGAYQEEFCGRMIAMKEYTPIPLECIVRGYYVEDSDSWEPYRQHRNMYGNVLPEGLKDSEALRRPIYTPSIKGNVNEHDVNISFAESIDVIRKFIVENFNISNAERNHVQSISFSLASAVRDASMSAYNFAHKYALRKGIIIADAKLEFGVVYDSVTGHYKLLLVSEAFTPDTCRFWSIKKYNVGKAQVDLDKQLIKRYVRRKFNWDGSSNQEPPHLPKELLDEVSRMYWNMLQTLFDKTFEEVTTDLLWNWKFAQDDIIIF